MPSKNELVSRAHVAKAFRAVSIRRSQVASTTVSTRASTAPKTARERSSHDVESLFTSEQS